MYLHVPIKLENISELKVVPWHSVETVIKKM